MKKLLKWLACTVLGLVGLIVIGAVIVYVSSNAKLTRTHPVAVQPIAIPTGPEAVKRGEHLALSRGCVDCHGKDFAGAKVMDDGAMGRIYGRNLTPGSAAMAGYTDLDWVRAIRHGVARDGHGVFIMPSEEYSKLSDADVGALVAFMKTLPAVERADVPLSFGPVSRVLLATGKMKLSADVIDHAHLVPPVVTPAVTAEYGKYLAVACSGCHGPNLSGGKIAIGPPDWPPARNLTPHATGDLAKWTEADFFRAIRASQRPDGTALSPVMPRGFAAMNDTELGALWAYLRTLPPVATGTR
ncbi:MAG: c-type cytochrome [Verrucomicrobia bacterium]|nr:c-type cytochrome [Verrucomicrobiota bacterium]